VARRDWENSREIDLSDEGLMADLEKRGGEGAGGLALKDGTKKKKKKD